VTFHTPNDRTRHERCTDLGRQIRDLQNERTALVDQITDAIRQIQAKEPRFDQIETELRDIQFQEVATLIPSSRGVRTIGEVVGTALTGVQAFALAGRRDELERERDMLRSELSELQAERQEAERRLENVDDSLSRLHAAFNQLDCGLGYFIPSG
jgi:predicted  nucleic acid-binding Zn-ribbon protein